MKMIFLGTMFSIVSIACNKDNNIKKGTITNNIEKSIEKVDSTDNLKNNDINLFFDSKTLNVVLKYKNTNNTEKTLIVGNYHNTFEEPPHEMILKKINDENYLILIFTNTIQLGSSSDSFFIFKFNLKTEVISSKCKFENIGVYSDDSGIDTLRGIKLYDYQVVDSLKDGKLSIELDEYKPYKFEDENKNKNIKFKIVKRVCQMD